MLVSQPLFSVYLNTKTNELVRGFLYNFFGPKEPLFFVYEDKSCLKYKKSYNLTTLDSFFQYELIGLYDDNSAEAQELIEVFNTGEYKFHARRPKK